MMREAAEKWTFAAKYHFEAGAGKKNFQWA